MHIAIAGNIGSGKTTLTQMLANHYGWKPQFESVINNPYLEDYYKDIHRWSLNLEIYFLKERFKDMLEIGKTNETIIQDRTIFEGVYVFVANNKAQGNMSETDFNTYMDLFNLMMSFTKVPDLMLYLRASVPHLVSQIQMRGRDYEQSISLEYLQGLNNRYEDFIYKQYKGKVLTIETDNLDFLHRPADFEQITRRIDSQLFGLFN
ncbi:MAG: deoxynucleoside kinase [Bacteroidaceae bacterium]|jgi:deoxyadenosine/deoxycytidine kinase|nr:deoxynucleoside kinase [Bacteroidaceae bacterium]